MCRPNGTEEIVFRESLAQSWSVLKAIAAVMVMIFFLNTSAYSFIYSDSAVDPELDQTLKGLTEHRLLPHLRGPSSLLSLPFLS